MGISPTSRSSAVITVLLILAVTSLARAQGQAKPVPEATPEQWVQGLLDETTSLPYGNVNHCPFPAREVAPLLVAALRDQVEFKQPRARHVAYRVLVNLTEPLPRGGQRIRNELQIEQLRRGFETETSGIRALCARGLGTVQGEHAAAAVQALVTGLDDRNTHVVYQSVQALERHGPNAAAALPRLQKLLQDPSDEQRASWAMRPDDPPASWSERDEVRLRWAAASARLAIAGLKNEFALYMRLDSHGRDAVAMALSTYLAAPAYGATPPGGTTAAPKGHEQATKFLAAYLTEDRMLKAENKPAGQLDTVKGCLMAMMQTARLTRSADTVRPVLEAMTERDADERSRKVAAYYLKHLDKWIER